MTRERERVIVNSCLLVNYLILVLLIFRWFYILCGSLIGTNEEIRLRIDTEGD